MSPDLFFTWPELAEISAGEWTLAPPEPGNGVRAVEDDSRCLEPGSLFVAIAGEKTDGHAYIGRAVESGAAAVCVARELDESVLAALREAGTACLRVPDTLAAFQQLARAHRLRFPRLAVVAVTGSSGKTSTKEMIAAVLDRQWPGRVLKTEGNTNNHFGVPRNLLRITSEHRAAVIELGTNHPGEIARLAALVQPEVGVVCNIGRAHLEFFGDQAGIAREKGALLQSTAADGVAVFPADAPHVAILAECAGARRRLSFGAGQDADITVAYDGWRNEGYGVTLTWTGKGIRREFEWRWGGRHQALNAAAAAAAGTALGAAPDTVVAGLKACELPRMRMDIREFGGVHWVNDAYNANPDSMRASLTWFRELTDREPCTKRIAVLGDMLELGGHAEKEHAELLDWTREMLPDAEVLGVGAAMGPAAERCGFRAFPDAPSARVYLERNAAAGHWVLLKGSRGVHLEQVVPWATE